MARSVGAAARARRAPAGPLPPEALRGGPAPPPPPPRGASGRPVTTRETADVLRANPGLVRLGDWVFPTIRPWQAGKREAQDACGWTIFAYRELAEAPAGVPTVIAETGLPTEGALATSEH